MNIQWTELLPSGVPDIGGSVASNLNMTALFVCTRVGGVGRLYISTDSGATWTEVQPVGDFDQNWHDLIISKYLVGGFYKLVAYNSTDNKIYTSADSGATWTSYLASTYRAVTDHLNTILISIGGNIYKSIDYGSSWTTLLTDGTSYDGGSCNFDASIILAVGSVYPYGKTMRSINSGVTWTECLPLGYSYAFYTAMDHSGTKMFLLSDTLSALYISTDSGATWTRNTSIDLATTDHDWRTIDVNADGSVIVVTNAFPELIVSIDGGTTWTNCGTYPSLGLYTDTVLTSADGHKFLGGSQHATTNLIFGLELPTFTPTHGPIGQSITVNGPNYDAGDTITGVTVGGTPASHTLTVDGSGVLSGTITCPVISSGLTDIIIAASVTGTLTYTDAFTVDSPVTAFSPDYGVVGSSITVSGIGWPISDTITGVTVGGVSASHTLTVDGSGIISGTITCPAVAHGSHSIVITGTIAGAITLSSSFLCGILQNSLNNEITLIDTVTGLPYRIECASGIIVATGI
jgi:hypothetical protein